MQFEELQLNKTLLKSLSEEGYLSPTPIQQKAIPLILAKKDIIGTAQTGTGKTAAFALPILERLYNMQKVRKKDKKIRSLIITPTRELAIQINKNFKTYGKYTHLTSTAIVGGLPLEPQIESIYEGIDILVATPGRLLDLHKQQVLNLSRVEILVLDEADLMLDMGFIDDVKKIERLCTGQKQILLFSATMPTKVIDLASSILNKPYKIEIGPKSSPADGINQLLFYAPKSKKIALCLHLLKSTIKGKILIFRRTKFGVDKLEESLLKNNYAVATLHGDKSQQARQEALNKFKRNDLSILIATDIAARGIDVDLIDAVINFDIPNIAETYVHRIGRTGRAGNIGFSYSFCSAEEKNYINSINNLIDADIPVEEEHPYLLDPKAKPEVHKKQGSKHRKGRKSVNSKKNKKRWY